MRERSIILAAIGTLCVLTGSGASAQTKADQCSYYAHNAMANTPTSTGVVRGAARGTVVGAISGNAGRGAAIGAAVGGTRRVVQKNRSYEYYYNSCMSR